MPADNIIGGIIGAGMGLALQDINDKRQREQSRKLMEQQIEGQKQLYDFQQQKQYEMWLKTNYPAQVEQLNKAGLNVGLLYGMGGAGGATVGGGAPSVASGDAPKGGGEIQDMMGMGLQADIMQAQIKLLESQTEKNKAETAKTAGVDTTESKWRTENLMQGLENMKEDWNVKRLQQTMMNIENWEKQASQKDRLDTIEYNAKTAATQLAILKNDGKISDATVSDKIKLIKQSAIQSVLESQLTKAQIGKTAVESNAINQSIRNMVNEIMIKWDTLENEKKKTFLQEISTQFNTDPVNKAMDQISNAIDNIFIISKGIETAPKRNPIGFNR